MLPTFVIIGAMKCGTVSLHKYLALHPDIYLPTIDEFSFFVKERSWSKGLSWYKSLFNQNTQTARVVGERSTNYAKYPLFCNVPERMHSVLPEAKLIYLVRDPIDRIVSHYRHVYARRYEHRSMEATLASLEDSELVWVSKYYMQIEQYLPYYPPERTLIISLEEMAQDRHQTLRTVFDFLGVDPEFEHEEYARVHHRSRDLRRPTALKQLAGNVRGMHRVERLVPGLFERPVQRPELTNTLREALVDVLYDDVEKLRSFTGCAFDSWSL